MVKHIYVVARALLIAWRRQQGNGIGRSRVNKYLSIGSRVLYKFGARRRARGYFGAAGCLRDFEIFQSASVPFPGNHSQVEMGINAA